ncbi:MAG: hypothetical protein M1541_14740 [Acidobacteria bacterium]|nr:hypothetical protein [Acidobacteriota bacterium]
MTIDNSKRRGGQNPAADSASQRKESRAFRKFKRPIHQAVESEIKAERERLADMAQRVFCAPPALVRALQRGRV